jgi:hypothetical protein
MYTFSVIAKTQTEKPLRKKTTIFGPFPPFYFDKQSPFSKPEITRKMKRPKPFLPQNPHFSPAGVLRSRLL